MTEVRRLTPDDWELWRAVRLEALTEAPYAFGASLSDWHTYDREERWRGRLETVPLNLIALESSEPVGQVAGLFADDTPDAAELISMWVTPRARGTGVAAALIDEVARWAREEAGAATLLLCVKETNARARRFYEKLGFELTGRRPEPDELQMSRQLSR